MATLEAQAPLLSDEDRARVIELLTDSDSVELKLTVPEPDQRSTVAALGLDPLQAEIRQVFFLDTPDLRLNASGLVARVRRAQKKGDDSVVKLRPVVPAGLPEPLRRTAGFGVEVDAMPGGFVCSASLKGVPPADIRKGVSGKRPLRKLFTKEQRALFAEHAPAGIELDGLSVLGPIFVLKQRYVPKGFDRKLVAEVWLYPDNTRILELSTKCAPSEAFDVATEARAFLTGKGVDLLGEQQTKTRTALEFFARALREEA
jgi:hypothetical protein